jgi:hypothetical protein
MGVTVSCQFPGGRTLEESKKLCREADLDPLQVIHEAAESGESELDEDVLWDRVDEKIAVLPPDEQDYFRLDENGENIHSAFWLARGYS